MTVRFSSVYIYPYRPSGRGQLFWVYAPKNETLQTNRLVFLPQAPSRDVCRGKSTEVSKDATIIGSSNQILQVINSLRGDKLKPMAFSQKVLELLNGKQFFRKIRESVIGNTAFIDFAKDLFPHLSPEQAKIKLAAEYDGSFGITADKPILREKPKRLRVRKEGKVGVGRSGRFNKKRS